MSKKRKDPKGRILKSGESYRKSDNLYSFRYKDVRGKIKSIYDSDLKSLRKKAEAIMKTVGDGVDYAAGEITVIELVEKYISMKVGVRYNTKVGYNYVLNLLKKEDFGYLRIREIKPSDAQRWFIKLHNDGKGYSSLTSIRGVLKPAFQMAFEEDVIRRNPFDFIITKYVPNDSKHREALTPEELKTWMEFIKNDSTYCKYYDEFVVLLGTGMRVSEFCGLTKKDLDFKNRRIRVDHQLIKDRHRDYYVEKTKTECGMRSIPMTNEVYEALRNILRNRPNLKEEMIVGGYGGFILIDSRNRPKVARHIQNECLLALKKYCRLHHDKPLPSITPHVYRHTFCTNMANAGMDVKVLQYIMGHSEIGVTLNVYTHMSYERAAEQMLQLVDGGKYEENTIYL